MPVGPGDEFGPVGHGDDSAPLAEVGQATDDSYELRITQHDLADALGLTSVHVNRVLMNLRAERLIHLKGGRLTIIDRTRLKHLAQFDPAYLVQ